jgi:SOS-response transcriptional repressor LexA
LGLNIKEIGSKLREDRGRLGGKLTQEEAAAIAGVSTRAWQEYERGNVAVPLEVLVQYAKARGISFAGLIGIEDEPASPREDDAEREIPILDFIPAGMLTQGFGEMGVLGYVRSTLKNPLAYALVVTGMSMYPDIQEGDVVICAPNVPFVNGKVYAVVHEEGPATLKKVRRRDRQGDYALIPGNPEMPTMYIPIDKTIRLDRVVEVRRSME